MDLPGACPITWIVIGANALTFLVVGFGAAAWWSELIFRSEAFISQPWSALTYALVADRGIIWLLVGGYVFWLFSGSLERSWGPRDYVVFLLLITAAPAIAFWVATVLMRQSVILAGLWLPLAATVVAWTALNPYERILVYFVIPLQARWLRLVTIVLVFFSFQPYPFGLFGLAGCGVAWWYVQGGKYRLWQLMRGRGPVPVARGRGRRVILNPLEAIRRWRRKRQFLRFVKRAGLRDLDS